jgi:hypothetical protein
VSLHAYPPVRERAARAADVCLVVAFVGIVALRVTGPFAIALAVGIVMVLGFAVVTLHHPRKVEIDERGVAFHGYGRVHRYAWSAVERVQVRPFLTGDRVLVRIEPAPPWRGRYWLYEPLEGYRALVDALSRRATRRGEASRSSP